MSVASAIVSAVFLLSPLLSPHSPPANLNVNLGNDDDAVRVSGYIIEGYGRRLYARHDSSSSSYDAAVVVVDGTTKSEETEFHFVLHPIGVPSDHLGRIYCDPGMKTALVVGDDDNVLRCRGGGGFAPTDFLITQTVATEQSVFTLWNADKRCYVVTRRGSGGGDDVLQCDPSPTIDKKSYFTLDFNGPIANDHQLEESSASPAAGREYHGYLAAFNGNFVQHGSGGGGNGSRQPQQQVDVMGKQMGEQAAFYFQEWPVRGCDDCVRVWCRPPSVPVRDRSMLTLVDESEFSCATEDSVANGKTDFLFTSPASGPKEENAGRYIYQVCEREKKELNLDFFFALLKAFIQSGGPDGCYVTPVPVGGQWSLNCLSGGSPGPIQAEFRLIMDEPVPSGKLGH